LKSPTPSVKMVYRRAPDGIGCRHATHVAPPRLATSTANVGCSGGRVESMHGTGAGGCGDEAESLSSNFRPPRFELDVDAGRRADDAAQRSQQTRIVHPPKRNRAVPRIIF
jgi:hypothetical protein